MSARLDQLVSAQEDYSAAEVNSAASYIVGYLSGCVSRRDWEHALAGAQKMIARDRELTAQVPA